MSERFPGSEKPKRNYYEILGVSRDASMEDIKSAFKKVALGTVSENSSGSNDAGEKLKEVFRAYDVLSQIGARRSYDKELDILTQEDLARRGRDWTQNEILHRQWPIDENPDDGDPNSDGDRSLLPKKNSPLRPNSSARRPGSEWMDSEILRRQWKDDDTRLKDLKKEITGE